MGVDDGSGATRPSAAPKQTDPSLPKNLATRKNIYGIHYWV
jgi:hypothetical protein